MAYASSGDSSPGTALTVAILTLVCCNLIGGVVGVAFAAVAMGKEDEEERARFTGYAWTAIVVGLVLSVLGALLFF